MKTEELKIGENTFTIKEMSFYDQCEFLEKYGESGKLKLKEIIKVGVLKPEITDELMKSMSAAEGKILFKAINNLNGWLKADFPKPQESSGSQSTHS